MDFVWADDWNFWNCLCSYYYNLNLSEIWVQGIRLELESSIFNGKFGTVLDSGTTYAYLPDRAFEAFRDAVRLSVILWIEVV